MRHGRHRQDGGRRLARGIVATAAVIAALAALSAQPALADPVEDTQEEVRQTQEEAQPFLDYVVGSGGPFVENVVNSQVNFWRGVVEGYVNSNVEGAKALMDQAAAYASASARDVCLFDGKSTSWTKRTDMPPPLVGPRDWITAPTTWPSADFVLEADARCIRHGGASNAYTGRLRLEGAAYSDVIYFRGEPRLGYVDHYGDYEIDAGSLDLDGDELGPQPLAWETDPQYYPYRLVQRLLLFDNGEGEPRNIGPTMTWNWTPGAGAVRVTSNWGDTNFLAHEAKGINAQGYFTIARD